MINLKGDTTLYRDTRNRNRTSLGDMIEKKSRTSLNPKLLTKMHFIKVGHTVNIITLQTTMQCIIAVHTIM